jgi:MFS family permease
MSAAATKPTFINVPHGCESSPPLRPRFLAVRLSALIFLAFAIMGAWVPTLSLYLNNLGFSPEATAWVLSMNALGAMIAPLPWGQIADRWLATERCISVCGLTTSALLFGMAELTSPFAVIVMSLVIWFFLIPVLSLTGAYIFRQLQHPDREYGRIRLWGTVGWMAASWGLTLWFLVATWWTGKALDFADSLRLGGVASLVVGIYALTLPHAPPSPASLAGERSWLLRLVDAPMTALRLFADRSFFVYSACMFGLYITVPFTVQLNPLLLQSLGIEERLLPTYLTIAQTTEVAALAALPFLLARFGVKATMIAGAISWATGLMLLSIGEPIGLVIPTLATSGLFICCFVIAGQVYVNRQATHDIRASAQGILVFINGSGLFLGNLLVGWLRDWTGERYDVAYRIAAVLAAGLTLLFAVGFAPATPARQDELVPNSDMS